MNFFKNASLGFDKAALINVPLPGDSANRSKTDFMRNELLANNNIHECQFQFCQPSSNGNWNSDFKFDHSTKTTNFSANLKWADAEYFKTFNLFVAGRGYYPSDTVREFVVNETLLRKLGISNPQDAIGKEINFWNGGQVANIVGVIKDFNSYFLRATYGAGSLEHMEKCLSNYQFKNKTRRRKSSIAVCGKTLEWHFPDYVYEL